MKTFITLEYYTDTYMGIDILSQTQSKYKNKNFEYYSQFGSDAINNLSIIDLYAGDNFENLADYYKDAVQRATAIMTEYYIVNGTNDTRAKQDVSLGSFSSSKEHNASDLRYETAYESAKSVLASAGLYYYQISEAQVQLLQEEWNWTINPSASTDFLTALRELEQQVELNVEKIEENAKDIRTNSANVNALALAFENVNVVFRGNISGGSIPANTRTPFSISQVINRYSNLIFTSPNTFKITGETNLTNQLLFITADITTSNSDKKGTLIVENSAGEIVWEKEETITDDGSITLNENVNLVAGESYSLFIEFSVPVVVSGAWMEIIGQESSAIISTASVVDNHLEDQESGMNVWMNDTDYSIQETNEKLDLIYNQLEID